jgi:regulatory protein
MRITKIRPHPRVPGYRAVDVDGTRFATVAEATIEELGLAEGLELDEVRRERLEYAADVEAAYRVAIRMLAARPRAVNELLRRLRDRGHNPSAAAEAVGRLEAKGLLDDAEYVRHFVRVRAPKGFGRSRLLTDVVARGVDRRVAERCIDEVVAAEELDPAAQAGALARRRAQQLGGLPLETRRRRLLAYLARRGFRGYDVTAIVDRLLGAVESDAPR